MRVAATAGAAAGTVDAEVRAELTAAGAMTMSALLVGVPVRTDSSRRWNRCAPDKEPFGDLEIYRCRRTRR